jgi:hypothetical protein
MARQRSQRRRDQSSPRRADDARRPSVGSGNEYFHLSARPLHIVVFLTPLLVLYEIGSGVFLASPGGEGAGLPQTIKAHRLFGDFFNLFGAVGLFLPALALVAVLILCHVMTRDRWRVRPGVLLGMLLESIAWTLPLLVLSALHSRALTAVAGATDAIGFGAGLVPLVQPEARDLMSLPWQSRLTIAVGAGLYEEMLFRLVGVTLLHFVFADLLRLRRSYAAAIAVVGAAVAFALYHHFRLASGHIDWPTVLFRTAAGVYFGMLYLMRGFGVVAATHAFYDVLVLVLLTGEGV